MRINIVQITPSNRGDFFCIKNKLTGTKKEVLFKENASLLSLQINQSNNQFIPWISIKKY